MNRAVVVPLFPSATVTSLIASVGTGGGGAASSFTIVPCPCPSAIVAPEGLDRLTKNVSFDSTVVSPLTVTSTNCCVVPAGKVSVPDLAT